jgi:galactose mutarotase-like enzyme
MNIQETTYENLKALKLFNEYISLIVVPERGGHVPEIWDVRKNIQWLYKNPALRYQKAEYGQSYIAEHGGDVGGFDECFPSVGESFYPAGPWKGILIPDHGEIWSRPWRVLEINENKLILEIHGVKLPYVFRKEITLENSLILFSYKATNLTEFEMPFLWSSHPLLAIESGMELTLPLSPIMRIDHSPTKHAHHGDVVDIHNFNNTDLCTVPKKDTGLAIKLFSSKLQNNENYAELKNIKMNAVFRMEFNPQNVTHFGLWLNYGGWAGVGKEKYFTLALEPCIGAPDLLDVSYNRWKQYGLLQPFETKEWEIAMELK